MAQSVEPTRQDSMADKGVHVDDAVESFTEDTESTSHEDITSSDCQPHDLEKPDLEKADLEKADPKNTASEPLRRTITAQDWNGPGDPENPLNWYDRARVM
jgi:hypothetical protein